MLQLLVVLQLLDTIYNGVMRLQISQLFAALRCLDVWSVLLTLYAPNAISLQITGYLPPLVWQLTDIILMQLAIPKYVLFWDALSAPQLLFAVLAHQLKILFSITLHKLVNAILRVILLLLLLVMHVYAYPDSTLQVTRLVILFLYALM